MLRELRQALRSLRSWPFGAVTAGLTLGIGIGTATSMYGLVRMALASTMPDVEDMPALGRIYASSRTLGVERAQLTFKDVNLLATASSFESVGAYTSDGDSEMTTGDQPVTISLGQVSAGFFPAMRAHAATGRLLSANDFREGAQVVVVSDRIWRTHFAGRSLGDAVMTLDGTPRTIVGVLPPTFGFSFIGISADAWMPIAPGPDAAQRRVSVLARLKPGVTWTAAAAELDALAQPQNPNGLWTWRAITVEQDVQKRATGGYAMMFGPALVVLLIGCTNVACMLLARGIDRDVELSVRSALGATRWRIIRQLIGENLVLAFVGGVLGFGLSYALLRVVGAEMAQFRPEAAALVPATTTLLPIGLAFSLAACLLFGTLPAIRLSRRDIATSLKGGTTPAVARFVGYRARDLVVFVELGLAVALVVTTAMFIRFFVELQRITPLFPADKVVVVSLPMRDAATAADRVSGLPGVSAVTTASDMPGTARSASAATVRAGNGRTGRGSLIGIDPAFFQALGIPIVRGRSFNGSEANAHSAVAVVSEGAAAVLWPGEEPLGARFTMTSRTGTSTAVVVGVSRNAFDAGGLARTGLIAPDIYLPLDPSGGGGLLLFARAAGDARLLLKPISAAARTSPSARAPHAEVLAPSFVHADSVFVIRLFGGFGLIALLLAGSGIFAVISQSVAQRTTEFGVRMAMGASSGQVLRMVLAREARLILASVGTGVIGIVLVTRSAFVEMLVITGSDPRLWLIVGGLCGGVATAAVAFATWRIVKLDPWEVLRQG